MIYTTIPDRTKQPEEQIKEMNPDIGGNSP
jgi:hypothetical protein